MTRTVVGNVSLSLDGRTAGPGGEYDMGWIVPHAVTDGARDHLLRVTTPATTVLLGRKNYQGFGGYWPSVADDESADPRDRAFSRWLTATEKIVFSTTLTSLDWANSRLATSDPVATVKDLRETAGGDVVVLASSSILRTLLRAGELDRLSVTLCPEISGGGPRLLADDLPGSSWALTRCDPTDSGAVCLIYDRRSGSTG